MPPKYPKKNYKKKRAYKKRSTYKKKMNSGKGRTVVPKYHMSNTMFVKLKA